MKYCVACGAKNKNKEEQCVACGGYEFEYHCPQCGAVFHNPNRCPQCGLPAGAVKHYCPQCGGVTYTAKCPQCGHVNSALEKKNVSLNLDALKKGLNETGAAMETAMKSGIKRSGALLKKAGERLEASGHDTGDAYEAPAPNRAEMTEGPDRYADGFDTGTEGRAEGRLMPAGEYARPRPVKKKKRRKIKVKRRGIVAAAVVLAVILVLILIPSGSGPEAAAKGMMQAIRKLDLAAAASYTSGEDARSVMRLSSILSGKDDPLSKAVIDALKENAGKISYEVRKGEESGGVTYVSVVCTYKDITQAMDYALMDVVSGSIKSYYGYGDTTEAAKAFKKSYKENLKKYPPISKDTAGNFQLQKQGDKWVILSTGNLEIYGLFSNRVMDALGFYG